MSYTGSVGCQNCIALNKKLELFDLLKQKCCKTDDITKNFLLLKTSYEKSAKLLENKSKKLSETRSKLKDAAKAEEISKRKAAEFQLRLVSSDMKCQDLLTELDVERQKNASLLQEKCHFENLVETKENEITSLNIISKQCEEKFLNDMNSLNAKMEKKIGGLKAEIQKQQELNSKLKGQGNQKKKHDKLREDIVDIFKDGFILAGEPLKRFKKLFNRLQENEAAAKLEAILDTPSMTPDGTTSSDTGVFSGDEDFGCPSLGNDLEMSSDSDEDFENVELQSDALTCSKMSKGNSSPSEDRSLTMEPDTELMQDTSGSNVSNDSVNDGDSTLCPIFTDSIADHSDKGLKLPVTSASVSDNHVDSQEPVGTSANFKLSAKAESLTNIVGCYLNVNNHASLMSPLSSPSGLSPKSISVNPPSTTNEPVAVASHTGITDSLFSPPGGDISPSLKGQERKDTYELSFDVSSVPSDKCSNSNEMASRKSDAKSEIVTSKLDSKLSDISVPSSAEELTNTANSLCSLKALEESQIPLSDEKEEPSGNSKDICLRSDIPSACSTPAAEFLGESSHNSIEADAVSDENRLVVKDASSIGTGHDGLSKILQDYKKGYSNFVKGETFIPSEDDRSTKKNKKNMPSNNSSKSDISAALSKLSVFKYQPPSDKPTSCAVNIHHDLSDDSIKDTKVQEDEMDLDTMLHEWNPPTPILPFSDDSCGFDSTLSSTVPEESPQKCSVTISVGTNTDIAHCRSTASSPISHLFVENSSSSSDQGSQHERSFKDAYSSPPKVSSCNRASSPMKIRYKNIGVMPIAEFSRTVAVSPVKVMKNTSATSPLRSLFRDVSVGPIQVETLDCATNTSNSGNSASIDFENGDESWSREAKMLQQTLEVLGISTGVSSGGVLDQSLVDELRKAMEMALRKTSKTDDIPRKRQTPSKQFDTSYCSFNPCEFAEICNQQHYNLHLLAKGKNVEKTMCSREKRRQKNLKRLNVSSHRRRSLSTLSFKEEIVEEDYSSQKEKQIINLSDDSITVKELSESNRSNVDTIDSDDSFNIRPAISPTRSFTKSVPHPEDVDRSKPVKQMNNTKSQVSAKNPTRRKSFVPEAIHPPKNNRPKVDVSGSNSSVDKNESAFCIPEDASSDAPEVDFCPIDKTSPEIEKNSMGLATVTETNVIPQSEPNLNDSDSSEDNLIIDESISSTTTVLPKVSECNASAEVPCKPPAHEEESCTPDNDHFVLPKPRRMSLRKRRQSSSSESSTAENSPGMNDSSVVPRRSPRMKKIRMANDGQSKVLQDCQKGYSNSRKGEMSVSSEGGRSTEKNNPGHNSPNSKISDALSKLSAFKFQSPVGKNLDEQATSDSITSVPESVQRISPNTSLSNKPLKRSAENKSMEEESSKRLKHPSNARPNVENDSAIVQKVSNLSEVVENGPEDSDTDMECDEKLSAGTANTKATYKSSTARKPSKLQKLRSTVSKVHPMVQGTKNTRSPGAAKEHLQESADQCMENPHGLKSESTINPKLVENFEDEASILERIRGRGNIRMAAAASGRTAQLIQVKPGAKRHQRPPPPNSPADYMPAKPLPRAARTQPLVRPADRVSALGRSIPSETTEKSTDSIPSTRNESTPQSPARSNENCQSSVVLNVHKVKSERSLIDTEVSVHLGKETYKSCFISDIGLRISTYSPLVCALTEQENSQPPTSNKIELIRTQVLVATTLKDFIAAPSFTSSVLQKAVDALSAPTLYNIMPVLVQNVVKMMDDDFDTAPLRLGNQQSFVPPLTPVQQQLVTLIVQLSSQHQHLQQLPHQLLRLLEYRVFRLGVTPEGDRLAWCSKLHAAICRIHRLRSQALIFCWDSLYTLRGRSYHVVKAVMDVWPHLFPVNPSFEKACPNAQVLLHLLRSFVEHKNGAQQSHFDNSWLKRLLRSGGIQSLSINSSILASTIFSNIISGAADTNVPALVLLAKREEENWTMRDIVSMKLLPALDKWCKKSLNDSAAERVIWILCSILRALPPERNGNTSDTLMKLLISELLKPETSLAPQMQEVIALGLVLLSRHNVENVAVALASWNPKYGPSRGYSSRLLQYLTSAVNSGTRPVLWWQNVAVKYSKCQLED